VSRWGLRDLGELCDHLHTAYNSPSRRSPSSTEAPAGAGPPVLSLPARRGGAASDRDSDGLGPALPLAVWHGGRLRVGGSKARGPAQAPGPPKVSPVVTHQSHGPPRRTIMTFDARARHTGTGEKGDR
jgi:hypothetical protein